MRTEFKEYDTFEVIFEFIANPDMLLVDNYQQNQEWLMYLHNYGVAMIRRENNYVVFDTYVAHHELKESQTTAIRNHFNGLNDIMYGAVFFLLISGEVWLDYIDKDRILAYLLGVAITHPISAKSFINLNLPTLTKLLGESFLDLFPFIDKPAV